MSDDSHITKDYTFAVETLGVSPAKTEVFHRCDNLSAKKGVFQAGGTRPGSGMFPRTKSAILLDAASRNKEEAAAALATLCETYRTPITKWFVVAGTPPDKAEDLTHDFLHHWLRKNSLQFTKTP